jgi:hypothetical protein
VAKVELEVGGEKGSIPVESPYSDSSTDDDAYYEKTPLFEG